MEWVQTQLISVKDLESKNSSSCHLFGCQFHNLAFVIDESGKLHTTEQDSISFMFPHSISQIVVSCQKDSDICRFYLRSVTNQVYEWILYPTSEEHPRKRAKLEEDLTSQLNRPYRKIASSVHHIMSITEPGVLLFSGPDVKRYVPESQSVKNVSNYYPKDSEITCHEYFGQLDTCFINFFSLSLIDNGMIFGTKDGSVYCRNLGTEPVEDTKILSLGHSEKVIYLELVNVSILSGQNNALVTIGDRGTIMIYSKASSHETNILLKQFNVQGPIHSIDRANKDSSYLISSGNGRLSILKFKYTANDIELESIPVQNHGKPIMKRLRMCSENKFDSLSDQEQAASVQMMRYKFQSMIPVSIANDPEAITQLTKEALDDLKLSELELKDLDRQEEKMSQRLASTNRTLYALQAINKRRKPGTCHSLESTGFEFSMRPVIKPESLANSALHATSYFRLCIKTTGFLELEDWEIELDMVPYESLTSTVVVVGETRTVPVMGFETFYENGIERYSAWERDIELDLEKVKLPLEISVCLTMALEHDEPSLRFPVSKMVIDDLHFAIPCGPDFITTVHRRGLEQVSTRLMNAYNKQVLYDKSNRYPFARLLRSKSSNDLILFKSLFDYKNVHIRCLIDLHITDEGYKSILSRILNEGKTMDEMKSILISAEQALFTLAAFPGCPVIIELSRVSSTVIDFNIQCVHPPALFKVEAALVSRLLDQFIQVPSEASDEKEGLKYANFLKRMKLLEQSILDLQDSYQEREKDKMEIDEGEADESLFKQLKSSVDLLLEIYNEEPIGQLII